MGPDGNSRKGLAHRSVTCHKPRNGSPTPFHNGGALPDPNHKSSGSPLPSPHAPARVHSRAFSLDVRPLSRDDPDCANRPRCTKTASFHSVTPSVIQYVLSEGCVR